MNEDVPESRRSHLGGFQARMTAEYLHRLQSETGEGHRDTQKSLLGFISMVFYPSCVRVECRNKSIEEIASEIVAIFRKPVIDAAKEEE